MIRRRRPIPRSAYSWQPKPKGPSLQWELIENGAIRKHKVSGREVCEPNALGRRIYAKRVQQMVQRQNYRCCLCGERLSAAQATFEHQRRRGIGAAFRDDRIVDAEGNWINGAAHWVCNGEKG